MALASRRRFLGCGLAGVAAAAAVGVGGAELISRGDLPGKGELDAIDGACSVAAPDLAPYAPPGPQVSGTFYSRPGTAPSATRSATRPGTGRARNCRW